LRDGRRVYWTIPVEVKFYIILPLIAFALFWAGRKSWLWGVLAGVIAAFLCLVLLWLEQVWSIHENVLLLRNLPPFLMGMAAAIVYGRMRNRPRNSRTAIWLEIAAIAGLLAVILRLPVFFNLLRPADPISKWAYDEPICGALWSIFILGTLLGRGWLAQALQWRPLRFLGLISFSAYLWHWKFLTDVDDLPVPQPVRLMAFLAIVVGVATVSYFLLERPLQGIRLQRSRASRRSN
jgi:peptidoglycan/LPS O-acetylase OafA/YrhL